MCKKLSAAAVWLTLLLSTLTLYDQALYAQEPQPQRVSTSTGIYDVQSRSEIHQFSAEEIRELVRMENRRTQNVSTHPHPILVYCFNERTFQYTGGKYQDEAITYRLRVPKNIRFGRKYPLVIHLHGMGDDSLTHAQSVLPMLIGPDQQDFFMLVPQAPRTGSDRGWFFRPSSKDGTLDVLVALMEHVIANNPIDKRRISVTGISSGGWGTWELIQRYPDMFAGAVPAACGAPPPSPRLNALTQTPVWIFNKERDHRRFRESIHEVMRVVNVSGGSMVSTEISTPCSHAWQPAMDDYNAFQWMLAQKRGSWFSPLPGVIVKNNPRSALLAFIMYIMPVGIIVFLLRGTLYGWALTAYQYVTWSRKL